MPDISLNSADKQIIEVLEEGRNTPSNIARRLDYSREYVSQRLKRLREHELVERVDRGLYGLAIDDTEGADEETEQPEPETETETNDDSSIEAALTDWEYGRSNEEQEANNKIAQEASKWLRDTEREVRRSDVPLGDFADDDPLARDPDTLWSEVIRAAWQHAAEKGYINRPHSRAYEWEE